MKTLFRWKRGKGFLGDWTTKVMVGDSADVEWITGMFFLYGELFDPKSSYKGFGG